MINSDELLQQSQYFPLSGFSLSIEEKTALQMSLVLLKNNNQAHRVNYWGKVFGVEKDYHIAQVHSDTIIGGNSKTFYSDDGGISWKLLTEAKPEQYKFIEQIRGPFIGNASFVYKCLEKIPENEMEQLQLEEEQKRAQQEPEDEDEDEEDTTKKSKAIPNQRIVTVLEEARLSFIINNINHDTSVVPRGALLLTASEEVLFNPSFAGLDTNQSGNLKYYVHARKPETVQMEQLLDREHLSKSLDFLDRIDSDVPHGCWSLQYDPGNNVVIGRSLLWPGYVFYHVPNTRIYGSYYFGSGEKNLDLCFML